VADVLAPPPRPAEMRLALELEPAPGIEPAAGTWVGTGVPFAEGWLASPDGLRVETDAGLPVPAELTVRGRWPRGGGVRWLGVELPLAEGARSYALVAGRGAAPAPAEPVRVEETADAFVVSTGPLRAEIPRQGGLLRRVLWRGVPVLEQDEANWLTHLADGRRFSDRGDPETRAVLEQSSPLAAVVRVDGRYRGRTGDPTPRWSARLHFRAGSPALGIVHTFTWVGTADALQVRELALGFKLARPMTRAALDESNEPGAGAVEGSLRDGRQLALVQESHFQWGQGESRFRVLAGPPERPEVVAAGERAGAWVDVSDERGGVALVLRDLWKQHPKELRAAPDRLTAYLWSGSGASPPLDLRFPALERLFGAVLLEQLRAPKLRAQWDRFRDPRWHDPTGFARTHDLQLVFHDGDFRAGGVAVAADAFDRPPLLRAEPRWITAGGVVGRIAARDEAAFPELEGRIRQVWDDVLALVEDFGDYGFFGHGSGPHHAYEIVGGRAVAVPWRFTGGVEYGFARSAWLAWLRGGDRRHFELAAAHSRYLNDLVLCHEDGSSRRKGDWFWSSGVALIPWGGAYGESAARREEEGEETPALGVLASFGFFIEHALLHWYLTGDARSLDVAREYGAALKQGIQSRPGWAERFVAEMNAQKSRHAFQRLEDLAVLWEQLGDPWFREEADRLARLLLPPDEPAGIRRDPASPGGSPLAHPYAVFYKAPNLLRYAQAVDGPARAAALRALRRSAEWALRVGDAETRALGLRMGTAFAETGDPLFLAAARRGLGRREAGLEREPTGKRGYRIKLSGVTAHAHDTLANEAALIAALAGAPALPAPFPALWKSPGLPPAALALRKEAGRELRAQLTASAAAALADPRGRPWPAGWTAAQREYGREGVAGPLVWRDVRIPAGAPAGEYRVELAREQAAWLLATDAPGAALVAPGGFQLGGEPDPPWHFAVPEGTRALRLRASDPGLVELRDARGEPVEARPGDGDAFEVALDEDGDGGAWSVRASRPLALALEGVAPVFAFGAPERLFAAALPADAQASRSAGDQGFPPGRHGRGLRVAGRDALVLAPGARLPDGRFERFDPREGTLEFFVRPEWDSALLPYRTTKGLFAIDGEDGSLHAYYIHALDSSGEPVWDLVLQAAPPGAAQEMFRAQRGAPMRWRPDAFAHVALVWYPTPDGQRWALWVDGVRTATLQGGGKRAWESFVPRAPTAIRVGASGPWKESGAIDGVIDELRVSSVARYKPGEDEKASAFAPPESLPADAATLAHFDFEGDTRGSGAGGAALEAELRENDAPPPKPRREKKPRPAEAEED
jgi:hypothetical protein